MGGYIYTSRWKAFWIIFAAITFPIFIGVTSSRNEEQADRMIGATAVIWTIIAPIDNSLAIQRAKKKIEDLKS